MTPSEVRAKEVGELKKILEEKRETLLALRLKRITGQLAKNHEIRDTRVDIARIKTVLREKSFDPSTGLRAGVAQDKELG